MGRRQLSAALGRGVALLGLVIAAAPARAQHLVPAPSAVLASAPRGPAPSAAPSAPSTSCDDLDAPSLVRALEAELPALLRHTERTLRIGRRRLSLQEYARTTLEPLVALARKGNEALCRGLRERFTLYQPARYRSAHVSAYYHPVIPGSRSRSVTYHVPLFRRPPDPAQAALRTADILDGALDNKGLELVYVESLQVALLVHIEGSVTVQLAEGGEVNLTPDGHNGHPYQNPYKLARSEHAVPKDFRAPEGSGQSATRAYFAARPDVLRSYWARDPHFVFFKETPLRGTGKFGELIPGRSAAVDLSQVPLGAALLLRSELAVPTPGSDTAGSAPLLRLVLAQDTGAAILGPGRLDLFVGWGEAAAYAAAHTSRGGDLYVLVATPKRRR